MTPIELSTKLHQATNNRDFLLATEMLVENLESNGSELEFIEVILQFMEQNPSLDYGMPGPLVHYLEKFYGHGYENKLFASLLRHPVMHTTWMLNRIINGTKDIKERSKLIELLKNIENHPLVDVETKNLAEHFLQNIQR